MFIKEHDRMVMLFLCKRGVSIMMNTKNVIETRNLTKIYKRYVKKGE